MVERLLLALFEFELEDWSLPAAAFGVSLDLPLASESEFWLEGAGEVISIGSPVDGGDILIIGVEIGMTRVPIDSSADVEVGVNGESVSVLTAMWAVAMVVSRDRTKPN